MEIVLPDGELLRTGMGALPGENGEDSPTWQSFKHSYGPSIEGMFSQSNFGVVVKMGFWLMPDVGHQSYMFTFEKEDSFADIVEAIRPLALNRVLGNVPQLRHVIQELAVTGKPRSHFYNGEGAMPREAIAAAARKEPVGDVSWVFYGTQYGDPATIQSQLSIIRSSFANVPGSKFYLPKDMPADHYLHSRVQVCSGQPILRELDWLNWVPNAAHVFFSPIVPVSGSSARTIMDLATRLHKKWGFDSFPTLCVAGREMHYIANIVSSPPNSTMQESFLDIQTNLP